jgi:hypothetical protein
MKNIDELLGVAKLSELMSNDKKDESKKVLWVLAIIGAVAGIAAVVYRYLSPDYLEDIDDDYDDFDDDFFDEDDEVEETAEEEAAKTEEEKKSEETTEEK